MRIADLYKLLTKEPFIAILSPLKIHFLIVFFDELGYPGYFAIIKNPSVLKNGIPVTLHKELC